MKNKKIPEKGRQGGRTTNLNEVIKNDFHEKGKFGQRLGEERGISVEV